MKELLAAIGHLVVLKRINRQALESSVGMCRTNMAASFHGNRPFPEKTLPKLRAALLLDNDYHFDPTHVHAIWPRIGKNTPSELLALISQFAVMPPLTANYFLNVIGELGIEAMAVVIEDSRHTLIIVQHDDRKFINEFVELIPNNTIDNNKIIEIHSNEFHAITTDQRTPQQVLACLKNPSYVWTWQRIRTIALNNGISPTDAAQILKITPDDIC